TVPRLQADPRQSKVDEPHGRPSASGGRRIVVSHPVALGPRGAGSAHHGQCPHRAAQRSQSTVGDPRRDPQHYRHVPGAAARPNLPATSGPGSLAQTATTLQESPPPLARTKRPPTTPTPEDPQDGNHPQRQAEKELNVARGSHMLATLENTPTSDCNYK